MKKNDMKIGKLRHCIGGLVGLPMVLAAQNPIVQTMYTADPAPMVHDGCFCTPVTMKTRQRGSS